MNTDKFESVLNSLIIPEGNKIDISSLITLGNFPSKIFRYRSFERPEALDT